ncbi:MAG: GerMN domain-containing protein, partial [Candidatus Pacebacteria bacterium]|nr:GerMN domain-containing protein [Candidatus Paceibacterota bacterium]
KDNQMCSKEGLVQVKREIPTTMTPIQDTIKLLLKGELTHEEVRSGITTEFPLEGLELKAASLKDGILTLTFEDLEDKTGGGSCRVSILWNQISETAKQFGGVKIVKFMPEELFQP